MMNHQAFDATNSDSTIRTVAQVSVVASALIFYGWTQAIAAEVDPSDLSGSLTDTGSLTDKSACTVPAGSVDSTGTCATDGAQTLPNLQWSRSQKNQTRVAPDPHPYRLPRSVERTYAELLQQSQTVATQGQLPEAIATISGIPKNSQHYATAQRLLEDWSRELIRQATEQYQKAEMSEAVTLLNAIPANSPKYARSSSLKKQWQRQTQALNRAIAAQSSRDWETAMDAVRSLQGTPLYNSQRVQDLVQQSILEWYQPNETLLQIATQGLPITQP